MFRSQSKFQSILQRPFRPRRLATFALRKYRPLSLSSLWLKRMSFTASSKSSGCSTTSTSEFHSRALRAESAIKSLQTQLSEMKAQLSGKRAMSSDSQKGDSAESDEAWIQPDKTFPKWFTPYGRREVDQPILVQNSLLPSEKVPFVPKNGRLVKWYTCGPTVYAPSHMGHARNYVTFDIIRNVLEYYFQFRINLVMNITDVDDKIILRARQNHLFEEYSRKYFEEGTLSADTVIADVSSAFESIVSSKSAKIIESEARVAALEAQLQKESASSDTGSSSSSSSKKKKKKKSANKKQSKELNDLIEDLGGQRVKLKVVTDDRQQFESVISERSESKESEREMIEKVLKVGKSALSESLDSKLGGEVLDQSIFRRHSEHFEADFFDDMRALNVRDPDVVTRVTEYIDHIIAYIQTLIAKGYAYESNESVYFSTVSYTGRGHDYPKLDPYKGLNFSELAMRESEGALSSRLDSEKRDIRDFALWKKSKSGEPQWKSPWGMGRPGWHIECSVMASHVLGDTLDIHSGGVDLKFPHHDNEMAQACAYYSTHEKSEDGSSHKDCIHKQWVNYWFHAGHLHIQGLKMSKSLKNFISIKEALEMNSMRQIRLMFLRQQWYAQMDYSDASISSALKKEHDIFEFLLTVNAWYRRYGADSSVLAQTRFSPENELDRQLNEDIMSRQIAIDDNLRDNFDYPGAMDNLFGLIGDCNVYLRKVQQIAESKTTSSLSETEEGMVPHILLLDKAATFVNQMLVIFGVVPQSQGHWLGNDHRMIEQKVSFILDPLCDFRHELASLFRAKSDDLSAYLAILSKYESLFNVSVLPEMEDKSSEVLMNELTTVFDRFLNAIKDCLNDDTSSSAKSIAVEVCELCDTLRDEWLTDVGVEMEDLSGGSGVIWKLYANDNRDYFLGYLLREKAMKEREQIENRIAYLTKEINVWHSKSFAVKEFFQSMHADKYSKFDEISGMPTHDINGEQLSKKLTKKLTKMAGNQEKAHKAFVQKQSEDGSDFLDQLRKELSELETQLSEI